jgi:hypothetical protein
MEQDIDTGSAHSARIYDYIIGGKDHYPADREAGDAMCREWPALPVHMRANRDFMNRAVRHLAEDAGIHQFLDIGTGIPTSPNIHEIAQSVSPGARVVYVDNDPLVLVHARALLQSSPQGVTRYVEADLRDPDKILESAAETLDFNEPVAITLLMILMLIEAPAGGREWTGDYEDGYHVVGRLMDAMPSGSYLAISHPAGDVDSGGEISKAYERLAELMPERPTLRSKDQVARFFDGLEMVEPGLVQLHRWRPDPADADSVLHYDVPAYAGVGRKP